MPYVSSLTLLFWENGYDVIAKLWKPVFLIAAIVVCRSVSSVLETFEKKLGIDLKFTKIAVPIGHIVFTPFSSIFVISSFFLASYFHMEISILWLVQLVFMSA